MRARNRLPATLLAIFEVLLALVLALLTVIVLSAAAVAVGVMLGGGSLPSEEPLGGASPDRLLLEWIGPLLLVQAAVFIGLGATLILVRTTPGAWRRRTGAGLALLIGLGAALVTFALSHALAALQDWLGLPVEEQAWVLELARDPQRLLRLSPLLVLLAPIGEEVFLRGYVFRFLHEKAGPAPAYAVSATLFALIHFNLPGLAVYVLIGLILAWVYRITGNLLAPITGHVCFNGLVVAGLAYGSAGS